MRLFFCLLLANLFLSLWVPELVFAAAITVVDAKDRTVSLVAPARRIVSLSPHTTEMLFSAKAGDRIVGTVNYSNFPPAAKKIPQVGGYHQLDLEKIFALQPDLVVAWSGGNEQHEVRMLMDLGLPVFVSEPHRVLDIINETATLAKLTGTYEQTLTGLEQLRNRWQALEKHKNRKPAVRVFYQLWNAPLMTINSNHMIHDLISQCGGINVFADLETLIPKINQESVIAADPEVIVASGMGENRPDWLDQWRTWEGMRAVQLGQLLFIPPDLIQRHSPRILQGAEMLCKQLEAARGKIALEK